VARIGKLSAIKVARLTKSGMYGDGGGLWLQVRSPEVRSWIFRYELDGKQRYMGLGPVDTIGLADARERASKARRLLLDGIDPIEARKAARASAKLDARRAVSFQDCAEAYIAAHKFGWRSSKHGNQWHNTLATYAYPVIGDLPVQQIDVTLVMKVLEPIWQAKTETASRLRGRIEVVLSWARTHGYRSGENPAAWRRHLENLLPPRRKVRQVRHLSALPYQEIGNFMASLRAEQGIAARALELTILTAARTSETLGATWSEVDLQAGIWTIPAERMKVERPHRIPLSPTALTVLQAMSTIRLSDYVFPGARAGRPLNNRALLDVLERMDRKDITAHGFRSTFRDWAAEQTRFPREICEQALGHVVGSSVERAYLRSDVIDRRRKLMDEWARFTASPRGEVVPLRPA
jgi:integrase